MGSNKKSNLKFLRAVSDGIIKKGVLYTEQYEGVSKGGYSANSRFIRNNSGKLLDAQYFQSVRVVNHYRRMKRIMKRNRVTPVQATNIYAQTINKRIKNTQN